MYIHDFAHAYERLIEICAMPDIARSILLLARLKSMEEKVGWKSRTVLVVGTQGRLSLKSRNADKPKA